MLQHPQHSFVQRCEGLEYDLCVPGNEGMCTPARGPGNRSSVALHECGICYGNLAFMHLSKNAHTAKHGMYATYMRQAV
eukprot:1078927-Pelagomonas_calceolata.AAC.2